MVYRLSHERYAHRLQASGAANRWNRNRQFVLYTSENLSLCALELLAHTGGVRPAGSFKVMCIKISHAAIEKIPLAQLPESWNTLSAYHLSQEIGSAWYEASRSLILSVPSAIIPSENNMILNTSHPDFAANVELSGVEDFFWDNRFPSTSNRS